MAGKTARGISQLINKLHGIDKPEPLQEGKGYSTEGAGTEIKKTPQTKESKKEKPNELVIWDLLSKGKFEETLKLIDNNLSLLSSDQKEIIDEWRKIQQEKRRLEIQQELRKEYGVTEEDVQRRNNILSQRAQLEKMGETFASNSGPIISNLLSGVAKPNPARQQAKEQKETKNLFDALNKTSKSEKQETTTSTPKKDPERTKISTGTVQHLRVNDSESDILAKMFLFMQKKKAFDERRDKENKKYRKKLDKQKDNFLDETIEALSGKKTSTIKKLARVARKSGFLKTAAKVAIGVGGLLVAKDALANIDWKKKFDDTFKDLIPELPDLSKLSNVPLLNKIPDLLNLDNKSLQDVIKKGEAGSRGYNAYNLGVAGKTVENLDLTNMQIKDIMKLQSEKKVFAAGAYQIIPDTMQDVVKGMKLTGEEKFDKTMQDKMFKYLAMTRSPSYKKYIETGDESLLKDVVSELSLVWAAIKDPKTGKGHYDKDKAGNMATIEPSTIISALKKDREEIVAEKKLEPSIKSSVTMGQPEPIVQPTKEEIKPNTDSSMIPAPTDYKLSSVDELYRDTLNMKKIKKTPAIAILNNDTNIFNGGVVNQIMQEATLKYSPAMQKQFFG